MRTIGRGASLKDHAVLGLFVLFILVMVVVKPSFVTLSNANNILIDVSIYGVAAVAMTISIITG
ncbi:MAG TPA: hypothetical protein VLA21_03455, partial [Candidatus Limnocylindria bacterium]|nr:hypothetical protein [Candidatus Limnocylindria bacterium]